MKHNKRILILFFLKPPDRGPHCTIHHSLSLSFPISCSRWFCRVVPAHVEGGVWGGDTKELLAEALCPGRRRICAKSREKMHPVFLPLILLRGFLGAGFQEQIKENDPPKSERNPSFPRAQLSSSEHVQMTTEPPVVQEIISRPRDKIHLSDATVPVKADSQVSWQCFWID